MAYQPEKISIKGEDVNYYEFLQLTEYQPGNSERKILGEAELRKSYRSKALIYHPDKNPDDPIAEQLFLQLKIVYDVLSDPRKRGDYDRYLLSVHAKRQRVREMDGARKKARDDLLQREKEARDQREKGVQEAARYETELDRLRKSQNQPRAASPPRSPPRSPSPQPNPEPVTIDPQSLLQNKLSHLEAQLTHTDTTLKIRWKRKLCTHTVETLTDIFSDYGTIDHIIPSSKKPGTALVSFNSVIGPHAAVTAFKNGAEKLATFEITWANSTHSEPRIVGEILEVMRELTNFSKPTYSKSKAPVTSIDYEATEKMTLEQFEAWTMARVQAFDQIRVSVV